MCSCSLFAKDETVEFELPQWPDYLPQLEGWNIRGGAELVEAPPERRHVSFHLPRNQPVCITATPITQNQFFKSAGTIYPYSNKITWSGGYAAQLYKIIPDSKQFNWEKLMDALESCENPWLLDMQEVLEGIAYHDFSVTKLKTSQTICVETGFEVFSSYVPENQEFGPENCVVTVTKGVPELFALRQSSGSAGLEYGLIICASSAKNISLDLVSMPIFKEEL